MSYTLSQIYPGDKRSMAQLHSLLNREGICLDGNLDYTCGLFDQDWNLAATGSTFGPTLRCCAVDRAHQGEGLLNQVVTHLTERQAERGLFHLFVYTKCDSAKFFSDLGFSEIVRVDGCLTFLENRRGGFSSFCVQLSESRRGVTSAAIVVNANPFTLGHRSLIERAAAENDTVHLFVLSEDASLVPFSVRWKLVTQGVADLNNVICHPSGPYLISASTFPSYFLKDEETVIRSHALLDLALFVPIAQSLGVTARYVGEEPYSVVTGLYNQLMAEQLPLAGIRCVVIPRRTSCTQAVSASAVRRSIHDGRLDEIRDWVPKSTWDFFHSDEAAPVIAAIRASDQVTHY